MATQKELIGDHPKPPSEFSMWLSCNDIVPIATKIHRELSPLVNTDDKTLIEWLGRKIFDHHHSDYRVTKLKENYQKLGFKKFANYADQHRKLPIADKTKKGNAIEIILTLYVEGCLGKELTKVFKLKYNPNVDQAIKGDDTLMVEVLKEKTKDRVKVYLGEAKFRATPSTTVIREISSSLAKDKKPLSYSFLIDELGKDAATKKLADLLDTFLINEIKSKGDVVYTGLLLSNTDTSNKVEQNLNSDNPNLIFISIGIDNPDVLVNEAYKFANNLFLNPALI